MLVDRAYKFVLGGTGILCLALGGFMLFYFNVWGLLMVAVGIFLLWGGHEA